MAAQWEQPPGEQARLEHDILLAQLDSRNYLPGGSGGEEARFTMPPDLKARVDAWHAEKGPVTEALVLPRRCIERLSAMQALEDDEARYLASCLTRFDAVEGLEDEIKANARVAAAATLLARGCKWLEAQAEVRGLVEGLIEQTVSDLEVDPDGGRAFRADYSIFDLRSLAIAVVGQWSTSAGAPRWERLLLRLMTSQHLGGASAVVEAAYAARPVLGAAWWRLLKICSMWAALALLTPHYGDPPSTPARWQRWRERLIRLRVWGVASSMQDLRLGRLALGVHRIDFSRQIRNAARSNDRIRRSPEFGRGPGLHTNILQGAFRWLLEGEGTGNWEHDVALCTALWKLEVDGACPKRDGDFELDLPGDQLGYEVVATLARKSVDAPSGLAQMAWSPVIELGPDGEAAVRHFLSAMFLQLLQTGAKPSFEEEWAHLVEFMLSPRWSANTRVYRTAHLVGQALGFGQESALARLPTRAVGRHADLYCRWASTYLHRDEDAVSGLCTFASTDVGAPILRDSLVWIAAALPESVSRFDKMEGNLLELCHKALKDHRAELRKDGELRASVMNTLDWLARRNSAPALVLQQQVHLINAPAK